MTDPEMSIVYVSIHKRTSKGCVISNMYVYLSDINQVDI